MTEFLDNRKASAQQVATQKSNEEKKDLFKNVPDIIEERRKDMDGNYRTVNKYSKGNILGKGGFAQVYISTSLVSKEISALKIVAKSSLQKPRAKTKLQTEIKIHRALNHVNIIRFEKFFEDPNYAYLVLELCSNNSMADLLNCRKRITEFEAKYYLSQLVSSLSYLHRHLVIHRDLKLGNLFIDSDMMLKVGDFGLAAKLENEDERRMTVCGTPNYIAPEILEGKAGHSFEVDIWSTGVVMYTLLVGKPPYQSKDVKSTYKRILANQYSYPDSIPVSSEARHLISRMLELKPEARASLREIAEHPFLSPISTPSYLPISAMKEIPNITQFNRYPSYSSKPINNENDPNVHNKLFSVANMNYKNLVPSNAGPKSNIDFKEELKKKPIVETLQPVSSVTTSATLPSSTTVSTSVPPAILSQHIPVSVVTPPQPVEKMIMVTPPQQQKQHQYTLLQEPQVPILQLQQHAVVQKSIASSNNNSVNNINIANMNITNQHTTNANNNVANKETIISSLTSTANLSKIGTVEKIHKMLDCTAAVTQPLGRIISSTALSTPTPVFPSSKNSTWVVRYVDYTSKYGLGFLFNDGAAGVYFNDSTKIVMSSNGKYFQYIERRKECSFGSDHLTSKYFINSYPTDLQKKVTLLNHFRNYLLEEEAKNPNNMNHEENLDMNALKTAFSKETGNENLPFRHLGSSDLLDDEPDLPFLKKWVKTKHAILFRISNRTVQVIFYDRSEVLLSSEAQVITYVNKGGDRSEHALNDIMLAGRLDIAKRLKYTKDIMHRLIQTSGQSK